MPHTKSRVTKEGHDGYEGKTPRTTTSDLDAHANPHRDNHEHDAATRTGVHSKNKQQKRNSQRDDTDAERDPDTDTDEDFEEDDDDVDDGDEADDGVDDDDIDDDDDDDDIDDDDDDIDDDDDDIDGDGVDGDGVDDDDDETNYLSVKDIVLAFALRGEEGLKSLDLSKRSHLLRKAVAFCRVEGNSEVAASLVAFANTHGYVLWPGRGRGVPNEGQVRSYKTQQLRDNPFIRLPVASLNVKKGQVVTVTFKPGLIEVRSRV